MDGFSDTSVKKILESTLTTVYPECKMAIKAEVKGHALKNAIGLQLNKFTEQRYKYREGKWFFSCLGFLLRGAKLDIKLNKLDLD